MGYDYLPGCFGRGIDEQSSVTKKMDRRQKETQFQHARPVLFGLDKPQSRSELARSLYHPVREGKDFDMLVV